MKKMIKKGFATLLLAGCFAMSLTSCLDTNEENQQRMTKEDVQKAYLTVAGMHKGKLVYPLKFPISATKQTDTLDVSWNITSDSVLIINKFPAKALAENIQDVDLKALVQSAPDQDLKCRIGFLNGSPITFVVNPNRLVYQLTKDGTTQKVEIVFYYNISGSIGIYDAAKARTILQVGMAAVIVDDKEKQVFQQGVFIHMIEDKK